MAITTTTADTLPHIPTAPDTAVATPTVDLNLHSGSFTLFGPLSIHYTLDLHALTIAATLQAFGVSVASGNISVLHPELDLAGNYHIAKWDLKLALDPEHKQLQLSGDACLETAGCKTFSITLLKW